MNVEGRPTCFQRVACWEKQKPLRESVAFATLLLLSGSLRISLRKDTSPQQSSKPQHLSLRKIIADVGRESALEKGSEGEGTKGLCYQDNLLQEEDDYRTQRRAEGGNGDDD